MKNIFDRSATYAFYHLAFEFYLLGRIAFDKKMVTSSTILFHHAIERLLLAELAVGKTRKYLQNRYKNHLLQRYWDDFKTTMNISGRHELDGVIKRLNNAVDLRFVSLDGSSIAFMPTRDGQYNVLV